VPKKRQKLFTFDTMSNEVRNLEPKSLWNQFADLNAVPRPSKKEERVIAWARGVGEKLGLPTMVDEVGNVIIKKPATAGMENRQTVVMQSHLDMVHQKNNDTIFDFDTQGIEMLVDGDWVKANGTTLGSDNGIGVAAIMAVLSSTDIVHPAIEALFTIDEETGMTGAKGLKGGLLSGTIMLNLDTEEDTDLTIGCAGGIDVTTTGKYDLVDGQFTPYKLTIKGLQGGHSGMEIHKGLGNANKLINRIMWNLEKVTGLEIIAIDGGGLRNAIPRESHAVLGIENIDKANIIIEKMRTEMKAEHAFTDKNLEIILEPSNIANSKAANSDWGHAFINSIYACPVGIYRMSPNIADLVQTSNNLARVIVKDGEFTIMNLTRGSVDSEKTDLANSIEACFAHLGGNTEYSGSYPGWEPKPHSQIVKLMSDLYLIQFGKAANVNACHAGLECGILGTNYPEMQMISFGPNIRGAHSPDECTQISSVQKFWGYLLETLKNIPK
jgi:dipeptidase D